MRFDGVRVDAVVQFRERAVEIPSQRMPPPLVLLQPLEFLDEVELELDRNPRRELKRDVLVGIRPAIAPGF